MSEPDQLSSSLLCGRGASSSRLTPTSLPIGEPRPFAPPLITSTAFHRRNRQRECPQGSRPTPGLHILDLGTTLHPISIRLLLS